jgi:hypothetical protein
MQKYATRGQDDIGAERAKTAVTLQATCGEKLVRARHVANRNVLLASAYQPGYTMEG